MSGFSIIEGDVIVRSDDKGTSVGSGLTSNPIDANTEALHVDGSNVTQPISASSLPLPAGAAEQSTLTALAATAVAIEGYAEAIETLVAGIKDTDGVKKITDQLPAGTNEIGAVAQGTKAAAADAWPVVAYDAAGNALTAIEGQSLIAGQPGYVILGKNNLTNIAHIPTVKIDAIDGERRLSVSGKISITSPIPPANTTPVTIAAATPLSVTGTANLTSYVITNATTLTIQSIIIGAEGDTTGGHKIEIFFWDGTTEFLIDRFYINADSFGFFPDTSRTRDGTLLTGNGTNAIRIYRRRLSGGSKEIDVVVRGFEL